MEDERLKLAIKALEWYADPDNWALDDWGCDAIVKSPDYDDVGRTAKEALKAIVRPRAYGEARSKA